jgi:hypothetical protein
MNRILRFLFADGVLIAFLESLVEEPQHQRRVFGAQQP